MKQTTSTDRAGGPATYRPAYGWPLRLCACLLVLAAGCGLPAAWDEATEDGEHVGAAEGAGREGRLPLSAQHDSDAGAVQAAVQALADRLLPEVAQAVGLEPRAPVQASVVQAAALRAILRDDEVRSLPSFLRASALLAAPASPGMAAPSLALDDDDAQQADDGMYQRVLGLYDPRSKRLVLRAGLGPQEQEAVMRHELTHALQDQHFSLTRLHHAAQDSLDASLALTAVLEGQAMVAMQVQGTDPTLALPPAEPQAPSPAADGMWAAVETKALPGACRMGVHADILLRRASARALALASGQGAVRAGQVPAGAPQAARATLGTEAKVLHGLAGGDVETARLAFPYVVGRRFIKAFADMYPLPEVVRWTLDNVPTSTHEIFHPGAYAVGEKPVELSLVALRSLPQHPVRWHSVLGELSTRLALGGGPAAGHLASGWRGDRLLVLDNPGHRPATVWVSAWRTPVAARRFGRALAGVWTARGGRADAAGAVWLNGTPSHFYSKDGFVAVVHNLPTAQMPALRAALTADLEAH